MEGEGGVRDSHRTIGIGDDERARRTRWPVHLAQLRWRAKYRAVHERENICAAHTASARLHPTNRRGKLLGCRHIRWMHERIAKSESSDKVGARNRCRVPQHLKHGDENHVDTFTITTCLKTAPWALVNCSCAHDGLRTMLQPSLNSHRNQPPKVAAASHAVGNAMGHTWQ